MPWPVPIGSDYQDDLEYRFREASAFAAGGGTSLAGDLPRLPDGVVLRWPVRCHARAADYSRIWFSNLLWLLLTFGLYWPWARARSQRFFLRHTSVAGFPMDYHAVPWRQVPRYVLMLGLMVGMVGAWWGSPLAGLLALAMGLAVLPLLVHVTLVHRLQHTSWAGRRLAFDGQIHSAYEALMLPLSGGVLVVWLVMVAAWRGHPMWWAGCGFAAAVWLLGVPLFGWAYVDYRQGRLRLGPVWLAWKGSLSAMLMLWLRGGVWTLLLAGLFGGLAVTALGAAMLLHAQVGYPVVQGVVAGVALLLWVAVVPYVQALMQNLVWSKTGHRALRFRSQLDVRAYVVLQCRHVLWLVLTLGLYWPWAVVASRRMRIQALTVWSRVDADVLKSHWPAYGRSRAEVSTYPNGLDTER